MAERATHRICPLCAPEFQLYLAVHTKVKTMFPRGGGGGAPHELSLPAPPVTAIFRLNKVHDMELGTKSQVCVHPYFTELQQLCKMFSEGREQPLQLSSKL